MANTAGNKRFHGRMIKPFKKSEAIQKKLLTPKKVLLYKVHIKQRQQQRGNKMALLTTAQIEKLIATGNFCGHINSRKLYATKKLLKSLAPMSLDETFTRLVKRFQLEAWIDLRAETLESACFSFARTTDFICVCVVLEEYARGVLAA